ncbi:MAG: phosphoenolpyruvate carboxykinase (ATP) [Gemmatimonadetes bacterium]|nr:phosphoenolpyruvate carboxykinase (ATP) [Gemmatimonadota bacterium]
MSQVGSCASDPGEPGHAVARVFPYHSSPERPFFFVYSSDARTSGAQPFTTRIREPNPVDFDLRQYGITGETTSHDLVGYHVYRNPSVAKIYSLAIPKDRYKVANNGALIAYSAPKTGRSPKDKRIVEEETTKDDIWWGPVNTPIPEASYAMNKQAALNYLNCRDQIYVIDGFAGWDPEYRIKVRIICTRAYHALFMHNMLIRPTKEELENFGDPDWVIFNAGQLPAIPDLPGVGTKTSVNVNFKTQEMVILGTEYAGEMKKGVFGVLHYVLPKQGVLSMHCSANEGDDGDVALFFGLSGTGKTTLSADPKRRLIGDDEHGWSDRGVFNFEGGCYAKTIDLSEEGEPQIYRAIRFGAVLENVGFDPETHEIDYGDVSVTQNTRCSYPIEFIDNAKIPCVGGHPNNIIFLTCDAFGVLPPVSKLTPAQAMYQFISGYTAKVAGTEIGITEPKPDFSACYGAAFLSLHPTVYAELLAEKIRKHDVNVWLVNTGWTGGGYGVGKRFKLGYTRAIIDAILDGSLDGANYHEDAVFGLAMPDAVPGVPSEVLDPRNTWADKDAYDQAAAKVAGMFVENFEQFADEASDEILSAAPKVTAGG